MRPERVLYVGQFRPGTSSYSRACYLRTLLPDAKFSSIDTLVPFYETSRLFRSIGFRWKAGPLIKRLNDCVQKRVGEEKYDLVWVDKAVFVTESTTAHLRERAGKLVHFTPDPAFKYHFSRHFERSVKYYDMLVTTKSFEIEDYSSRIDKEKLLLVTQGYDPAQHYPRREFEDRIPGVCFIGHHEGERQEIIEALLRDKIPVFVAGRGWKRLARKYSGQSNLVYGGAGVFGDTYAEKLSEYQVGLGMLSTWIPEKHTTRTFEIPACGSLLATRRNSETTSFFDESEALFFDTTSELLEKLHQLLGKPDEARKMADNGFLRVTRNGYDYKSIISKVLNSLDGCRVTSSLDN